MRGILLAASAVALSSSFASAADMSVKAPVAVPVTYTWTGCYIGVNTGGAWAHKDTHFTNDDGTPVDNPLGSTTARGWAYGGQIGCDYQFNNKWLVGILGMWDGSNMSGSSPFATFNPANTNNYKIDSFGTLVGKLGFLLTPTVQLYGLGGVAWVRDELRWTNGPNGELAAATQTRTGYDVGVGLAWMFAHNWDIWVEYDHMGFGTKNFHLIGEGIEAGFFFDADVKQSVDKVLVGIDFRFGGPVSMKY